MAPLVKAVRPVVVNLSSVGVDPKDPRKAPVPHPLGSGWLERFLRSSKPLPGDWPADRREEAFAFIERRLSGAPSEA